MLFQQEKNRENNGIFKKKKAKRGDKKAWVWGERRGDFTGV